MRGLAAAAVCASAVAAGTIASSSGRPTDAPTPFRTVRRRMGFLAMFITRKHIRRRTVLKGVGASVGLPLLDAMVPAATALAQTAAAAKPRMVFVYFPH